MDGEILNTIKNLSLESLYIALCVFVLTMLIKWPIKKCTNKLSEEKRKAFNTVILFIPIVLSLIGSTLYYGIFKSFWFTLKTIETAFSSWVVSLSIYAIYERVIILIKGISSGKVKINSELTKETLTFLKDSIKTLSSKLKVDKKQIKEIQEELTSLNQIKNLLESDAVNIDIAKLSETNIKIQELLNKEKSLKSQIESSLNQIKIYTNKLLNKEGENNGI